jgi:hypothetical protein
MNPPPTLNFAQQDRRGELRIKPMALIQQETAIVWADRAIAAYTLYLEENNIQWLLDGDEYYHEALEHAVLASVATAASIQQNVAAIRLQAYKLKGLNRT